MSEDLVGVRRYGRLEWCDPHSGEGLIRAASGEVLAIGDGERGFYAWLTVGIPVSFVEDGAVTARGLLIATQIRPGGPL